MDSIFEAMESYGVVPVTKLEDAKDAVPLAKPSRRRIASD